MAAHALGYVPPRRSLPLRLPPPDHPRPAAEPCDGTTKLRVHFYDVAQGLAALVDLPDGQHMDTGESASRAGCGAPCKTASQHLVEQLTADLGGEPVAMVWITHQHSDHLGGAPAVLAAISAKTYVDNGTELDKAQIVKAHDAATARGAALAVVDPQRTTVPVQVAEPVHLRAVVPSQWPGSCASDPNNCSIGLRIDFCASSILFTSDAEAEEEALLDTNGAGHAAPGRAPRKRHVHQSARAPVGGFASCGFVSVPGGGRVGGLRCRLHHASSLPAGCLAFRAGPCTLLPVHAAETPDEPRVIVVSGLPGVGKSTAARLLAARLPTAAHVEADVLQALIVSGGQWPGAGAHGDEAKRQLRLRLRNSCLLARSFAAAGFTAIVDDIVGGDRFAHLTEDLEGIPFRFVMLLPEFEHVKARWRAMNSPFVDSWDWIDDELRNHTPRVGLWLDTTHMTPDETVDAILDRIHESIVRS